MTAAGGTYEAFERRLEQVAKSDAGVLLVGESGSGKARAARRLHALGTRAGAPLVEVALAALAPTLIEAELFGHAAGAFTGARAARLGRFRQAQGGTLVLDDVDALPREFQTRLLRVLQERLVEPVGEETGVPIDVRVVATTQRDPARLVEQGLLRTDLYYRLAVVVLEVPPLRERREELPDLCAQLLADLARRRGLPLPELAPAALERLAAHAWPGNVRELENALERAVVLRLGTPDEGRLAAEAFDFLDERSAGVVDELARTALAHGLSLSDLERALLRAALSEERGNLSAAARRIGLTRRAAEYRLARAESGDGEAP
ncbi:MAG TPA: sigma 54-interacting transcriptional regulator [Planctomycetota bacterium]|nr:sigma 54-interacting transcriptional regulator [Planctomycetota bacterium]